MRWRASTQRLHGLNTRSATSINPRRQQTTVSATDHWTAQRDAGRINQHQPQASTGHGQRDQSLDGTGGHQVRTGWNRDAQIVEQGPGRSRATSRHRWTVTTLQSHNYRRLAAAIRSRDSCPRAMSAVTGTEQRVRFHPYWVTTAFSTVSVGNSHASMEGQRPSRRRTARLAASASTHCGVSTTPGYDWCGIARSCRVKEAGLASCHGTAAATAASATVMTLTSNHNSLFGSPTPRDPRSPTPWPRPCSECRTRSHPVSRLSPTVAIVPSDNSISAGLNTPRCWRRGGFGLPYETHHQGSRHQRGLGTAQPSTEYCTWTA